MDRETVTLLSPQVALYVGSGRYGVFSKASTKGGGSKMALTVLFVLVVKTVYGPVEGISGGKGTLVFKGIPYTAPPVGERRWMPSVPPQKCAKVRKATAFSAYCPQPYDPILTPSGLPQSEDCLTLNVWTPALQGKRPIMLWIHGGAFISGSANHPFYDSASLARRGAVVVVMINYRLATRC